MPVHLLTILAMSSSSTSSLSMRATPFRLWRAVLRGVELSQLGFQSGQFAVLDLRGALELALAGLLFGFEAQGFNLLLQIADAGDRFALLGPAGAQGRDLLLQRGQFALDFVEAGTAVGIGLPLQGGALDFERGRLALELVDLRRHGADLDGERSRRLVDQVDGLVGQEAVADVAVRQASRRPRWPSP